MNSDNIKGAAKKFEGSVESTYGSATGNTSAQAKGEAKKAAGAAQNFLGQAEDKIYDLGGKVRGFLDSATDNFSDAKDKVTRQVHEKPVQSSLIALAIGYVLGRLFRR